MVLFQSADLFEEGIRFLTTYLMWGGSTLGGGSVRSIDTRTSRYSPACMYFLRSFYIGQIASLLATKYLVAC